MPTPPTTADAACLSFPSDLDGASPTMDDLPSEFPGEEGLPNEFHALFAMLLMETFCPTTFPPDRVFSVLDMYLYFPYQGKTRGFRPDWFGVVDVPALYEGYRPRQSYVTAVEGKPPLIIAEALSKGTARNDLGRGAWPPEGAPRKWDVYERVLRIPYYVTIDYETEDVRFFQHDGTRLVEVETPNGRLWMPEAGLWVGRWQGVYRGLETVWVRFFDPDGAVIPTWAERTAAERADKAVAQQVAEEERRQREAAQLAAEEERRQREAAQLAAEEERRQREAAQLAAEEERRQREAAQLAAEEERRQKEAFLQETEKLRRKLRELGVEPD
ncbi:MAG: Uma2 family endonuclease [Chloracidobacterium sp.]